MRTRVRQRSFGPQRRRLGGRSNGPLEDATGNEPVDPGSVGNAGRALADTTGSEPVDRAPIDVPVGRSAGEAGGDGDGTSGMA